MILVIYRWYVPGVICFYKFYLTHVVSHHLYIIFTRGFAIETIGISGETVSIKGTAPTTVSYVIITITNSSQEIIEELETPLTGNGNFSLPWIIPPNLPFGMYIIEVSDNTTTDSVQIDIQ